MLVSAGARWWRVVPERAGHRLAARWWPASRGSAVRSLWGRCPLSAGGGC